MERFQDQGFVLSARAHGEHGAIVSLLTEGHGRAVGYVRGAQGSKLRGSLEVGNLVDVTWQSRTHGGLGAFTLELSKNVSAHLLQEPLRLAALQSACALCDAALPEREAHAGLYHGLAALFDILEDSPYGLPPHPNPPLQGGGDASCVWGAASVMWEIALLKELGFSLDLTRCASGNGDENLIYVSPKTGKAVSASAGAPYKGKLLALPGFLRPNGGGEVDDRAVYDGLRMTGYFLEHWVFTHHSRGVPDARLIFEQRFAKTIDAQAIEENAYGTG